MKTKNIYFNHPQCHPQWNCRQRTLNIVEELRVPASGVATPGVATPGVATPAAAYR
ncbi:hypothetical protein WJR50_26935 [Catalinimonas sp. 4WD22]|uniref:hypothetical protein n=1 Tax=Catalinimonas locisalis TaxID=3133978 RepID=UPI003100BCCD